MVAAVIRTLLRRYLAGLRPRQRQPRLNGGAFGRPCTEVNVGDIPAGNREYVRSLTRTIQINILGGFTDSVSPNSSAVGPSNRNPSGIAVRLCIHGSRRIGQTVIRYGCLTTAPHLIRSWLPPPHRRTARRTRRRTPVGGAAVGGPEQLRLRRWRPHALAVRCRSRQRDRRP